LKKQPSWGSLFITEVYSFFVRGGLSMNVENIHWLGHASFRIDGAKTIYIDPWQLRNPLPADLILVTHSHYDHFSTGDIQKIQTPETTIVSVEECTDRVKGTTKTVKPGDRITVEDIVIEAVPAYNMGKQFHPKSNGWVGFIVEVEGVRLYHTGDTDVTPELEQAEADIVLFPVGGTYTMDATEAAGAANTIKPDISIPMHYGTIVGGESDAKRFQELCDGRVVILREEK
jgi:L-ascorbate metabolism protein UlaG (beta-lactamase superfamily)